MSIHGFVKFLLAVLNFDKIMLFQTQHPSTILFSNADGVSIATSSVDKRGTSHCLV